MQRSAPPSAVCFLVAVSLAGATAARAQSSTLVGWEFEDGDLIADTADARNIGAAVTTSSAATPAFPGGDGGGQALSFSQLADENTSFVEFPIDASDVTTEVRVSLSLQGSNTASRYWRMELAVGAGTFAPVGDVIELTSSSSWARPSVALPGAATVSSLRVRVVPIGVDGVFRRVSDTIAPATAGTLKLDHVVVAAVVPVGPLPPAPVITEVAWMGTTAAATDEWIELYNGSSEDIASLASYQLEDNNGARALPDVPLEAGAVIVLEASATTTSLVPPEAATFALSLTNGAGTEFLRVCPQGGDITACDVALLAGAAWPAGTNGTATTPKRTMVRTDATSDGASAASWTTFDGAASSVTDAAGGAIYGSPGNYVPAASSPVDAGPDDGGTSPPDGDAGSPASDGGVLDGGTPIDDGGTPSSPNVPPTVEVSAGVEDGDVVRISYVASDADDGESIVVDLYLDDDNSGNDGVQIVAGLPGGAGEYRWDAAGAATGDHYVFAKATDMRGASAYAYAPAPVRLSGDGATAGPSIVVLEPDGVNDTANGKVTVRWRVSLPAGGSGTVSLGYDEDGEGFDGQPIIAGLVASGGEGSAQEGEYIWDTTAVPPGNYAVYAEVHWEGGQTGAYGGFVELGSAGGCTQASTLDLSPWVALLLVATAHRRRSQSGRCAR